MTVMIQPTAEQQEQATVVPEPETPIEELSMNDYVDRILRQVLNIEGAR